MTVDLHGTYLIELPKKLDELIMQAINNKEEQLELITGPSVLKEQAMKILEEDYGYEPYVRLNNLGIVVVDLND